MAELELRHLRAVRAVADSGSVTKAAAHLGVSQPALSAQLTRIERILGGKLFDRGQDGVTPTALGRFVLQRAGALLSDLDVLVSSAREHAESEPAVLRVGSIPMLMVGEFVDRLRAMPRWHEVETYVEGSSDVVAQLLSTSRTDVALYERTDSKRHHRQHVDGASVREFSHEPVFVAMAEDDPVAENEVVELGALADREWVVPPPHENAIRERMMEACARAGFVPKMRHYTSETSTARTLVARGAVSLAAAGSRDGGGLVVRPIAGHPLVAELLFGYRDEGWLASSTEEVFRCAARAYHSTVDRNPAFREWWDAHPETHAAIDAVLAGG